MNQKPTITQEIRQKIKDKFDLDQIPSDEQIIGFLRSLNGNEGFEIGYIAREYFTDQKRWIETKSHSDDSVLFLMTIKKDLGL